MADPGQVSQWTLSHLLICIVSRGSIAWPGIAGFCFTLHSTLKSTRDELQHTLSTLHHHHIATHSVELTATPTLHFMHLKHQIDSIKFQLSNVRLHSESAHLILIRILLLIPVATSWRSLLLLVLTAFVAISIVSDHHARIYDKLHNLHRLAMISEAVKEVV